MLQLDPNPGFVCVLGLDGAENLSPGHDCTSIEDARNISDKLVDRIGPPRFKVPSASLGRHIPPEHFN